MLDLLAGEHLRHLEQRVSFVRPVRGGGAFPAGALLARTPWGALAAARRWRPDVVHGWLLQGNLFAAALKLVVPSARVVTSERNLGHALTPPKRALERVAAAVEDVATANSSAVRDAAVARLPGRDGRMVVIPPGVAAPRRPSTVSASDAVMVGRLHAVKDQPTALRAWQIVVGRHPGATLSIVGDGPERKRLHHLARALGIASNVEFRGATDPAAHLYGARIFLQSSRAEGFSRALIEALGAGLPAVCTEVGGVGELPLDAVRRVPVGDADAMAQAMVDLLEDDEARARAAAAATDAAARYAPDVCHRAYATLYERLTAHSA